MVHVYQIQVQFLIVICMSHYNHFLFFTDVEYNDLNEVRTEQPESFLVPPNKYPGRCERINHM